MYKAPRYSTARLLLTFTTIIGAAAVVIGIAVVSSAPGLLPGAIGVGVAINGLVIVASAQMGGAVLDTAIATRDTADLLAQLIRERSATEAEPKQPTTGLRATR